MILFGRLADALKSVLPGNPTITGYGLSGFQDGWLLCNNIADAPYSNLCGSFAVKVPVIETTDDIVCVPGFNGNLVNANKTYKGNVTVICDDSRYNQFQFFNCTFDGDLTIIGGTKNDADDINLNSCRLNGDITVKDNDGRTRVYFSDSTIDPTSTACVTEKTPGGAESKARIGWRCQSVGFIRPPSGMKVTNDKVSFYAVLNSNATINVNGVVTTGNPSAYDGKGTYLVDNYWQDDSTPVFMVFGDSGSIDTSAVSDTTPGYTYQLLTDSSLGVQAIDTVFIPKAGSTVSLFNATDATFKVKFDETTIVDPQIRHDTGYYIAVPADPGISYQTVEGTTVTTVTPTGGKLPLAGYDGKSPLSLIVTRTVGEVATTVRIDGLTTALHSINGEVTVSTAADLTAAMTDTDIRMIHISGGITLTSDGGPVYAYNNKIIDIPNGATLTILAGVTLEVGGILIVRGVLSVEGRVDIFGGLDPGGNWDAHIQPSGSGRVYTYHDLQAFAADLYNMYRCDYGLQDTSGLAEFQSCYNPDYFSNASANNPDGVRALNFLIKNGVIDPATANLVGWQKITYEQAIALLDKLAGALETALGRGKGTITGYDDTAIDRNALLCDSDKNPSSPLNTLYRSFSGKVGPITVLVPAAYGPGLNNTLTNVGKTYSQDVTVNCGDIVNNSFNFIGCTFNGNLIINGGEGVKGDDIQLIFCAVNGNIIVKDDDGNTGVTFNNTTFANPGTKTVTVTGNGAPKDSARLGWMCNTVRLNDLPSGVKVINDQVAVTVYVHNPGAFAINGVAVTGAPAAGSYALAKTCWSETDVPVLVLSGATVSVDASGVSDEMPVYGIIRLVEDSAHSLYASDTVFIPKTESSVVLQNSANAQFSVDIGGAMFSPAVGYDAGYFIAVPDDTTVTYGASTSAGSLTVTQTGGRLILGDYSGTNPISLSIIYSDGTTVRIDGLPVAPAPVAPAGAPTFAYINSNDYVSGDGTTVTTYTGIKPDGTTISLTATGSKLEKTGVYTVNPDNSVSAANLIVTVTDTTLVNNFFVYDATLTMTGTTMVEAGGVGYNITSDTRVVYVKTSLSSIDGNGGFVVLAPPTDAAIPPTNVAVIFVDASAAAPTGEDGGEAG
jgi:hypothetical protein